jgi:glycosyltransferase involved in cell wall biosynthesis
LLNAALRWRQGAAAVITHRSPRGEGENSKRGHYPAARLPEEPVNSNGAMSARCLISDLINDNQRSDMCRPIKFSIVTASYNQGRFVRDCIESVKAQTGVEWEHIVQDAGSTDETLAVLKEYPHLQVTCEPDNGMSDGINRGFLKTTGDWVMWLNTDDYLLPGALAKVAEFAGKNPGADFVYGEALFVNEQKIVTTQKREHRFDFDVLLYYGCYIMSTAAFIRRRVLDAGHILNENYRVCMDFEYYLRLARLGYRFAYLPEALAAFRWHETNTSTIQLQRRLEERVQVQHEHLRLMGKTRLPSRRKLAGLYQLYRLKRAILKLAS